MSVYNNTDNLGARLPFLIGNLNTNTPVVQTTDVLSNVNRRQGDVDMSKNLDTSKPLIENEDILLEPITNPENDEKVDIITKPYSDDNDRFVNEKDEENGVFDRAGGRFPYAPGFGPNGEFIGVPIDAESITDVNIYQHKKTVAQGMMDLALFSANANQLRYVLESNRHPYYYSGIVLISISLLFQIAVGVGLILNTRYDVKDKKEICVANKVNNVTVIGIFMVTVINVFISAFGVASNATMNQTATNAT